MLGLEAGNARERSRSPSVRATKASEHDDLFDGLGFRSAIDYRFLAVALR
jgi:hypothetical protein